MTRADTTRTASLATRAPWSTLAPAEEIGFGVYVHIPFCRHKCDYCAFATFTDRAHLVERYLAALRVEIERATSGAPAPGASPSTATPLPAASTIFVGGGTPSLVDPQALVAVLDAIPRRDDAEFTIECNPDDVTVEMLRTFRSIGVNRISLGMQSSREHVLLSLGRTHTSANVQRAVDAIAEAGIDNFNVDVIYGGAGESLEDWSATIDSVITLGAPHVSAYGLTVENGTALAEQPDRHPDDDDQADKYDLADDALAASGRLNYEISNWALPGRECRHNAVYWSGGDYAGFGSAAHAHRDGRRSWNVRTPDRYIELIESGESAESSHESLDARTRKLERLQLQLRTRDGVPLDALSDEDRSELSELVQPRGDRLVLTRAGRLLANEVSLRLRA
ncbi:MAG: radical SAM family heme chaperone HemW [Actinobacteria bacterium]|nr:radical SAM family heme chaperone HemW [Actinomycetota bacterium]